MAERPAELADARVPKGSDIIAPESIPDVRAAVPGAAQHRPRLAPSEASDRDDWAAFLEVAPVIFLECRL